MEDTGNSTVAATTVTSLADVVSIPGPNTTSASHQDIETHTHAQTVIFDKTSVEMEAVRQEIMKITRNTEEQKKYLTKRLIELLNPILGKCCKVFYKQHTNIDMRITYSKHHKEKNTDILCKAKENADKEQP